MSDQIIQPATYNGIEFAIGYNRTFEEFKKEFGDTHVFKNIPEHSREAELKAAYKIATDGNLPRTTSESQKAK